MYVCVCVCIYLWPDLSFINNRDVGIIESHQVIWYGMLLLIYIYKGLHNNIHSCIKLNSLNP